MINEIISAALRNPVSESHLQRRSDPASYLKNDDLASRWEKIRILRWVTWVYYTHASDSPTVRSSSGTDTNRWSAFGWMIGGDR